MTDLKLPPRRTLPPDTRDRIRGVVDADMSVEPPARRTPLAAAAAVVAVLALGAVVLMQSGDDPDNRPATTPQVVPLPLPDPWLAGPELSALVDRCAAAMPDLGPRAAWQPAMGVQNHGIGSPAISVVGARLAGKPVICQTTASTVTVTDPAHQPGYVGDTGTAALLNSPEAVFAGIADDTWPSVALEDRAASTLISTHTRAGFFVRFDIWPMETARLRAFRTVTSPETEEAKRSLPVSAPSPPLFVVDRPDAVAAGDQALFDRCLAANPSMEGAGWTPAVRMDWGMMGVLLTRAGDRLGACRYDEWPEREPKHTFTNLPAAADTARLCRIPHVSSTPAVLAATTPPAAAYVEVMYGSKSRLRIPVVQGTFAVHAVLEISEAETYPITTVSVYDKDGALLTEGLPGDC